MVDIPSTPADGNVKVAWVPTIADPSAPTVTELTATGVVDLSCYLTADGWTPALDEQTISDDRLCSTATFEQPGRSSRTLDIMYIDNTNNGTQPNDATETLIPGTAGYLVRRGGVPYDQVFASGDVVDVWPVTAGKYAPQPPEANSVLRRAQKMFVTGQVRMDASVAA